jgi:tetratricopeptide (TPR) repeat protein
MNRQPCITRGASGGVARRRRPQAFLCWLAALWLVAACSFRRAPELAPAPETRSASPSPEEKLTSALKTYGDEVQETPDDAGAQYNLGVTYAALGRWDEAASAYQEAIRIKPNLPRAHNNLCVAYAQLGRSDDAIAACKQAVAIEPSYAEAFYNLGLIEARLDRWQDALGAAHEAVRLRPDLARPHFLLGVIANALGDTATAAKERDALRDLDPEQAEELSALLSAPNATPGQAPRSSR